MEKRLFDPDKMDSSSIYKILGGCVVPRPIGFISTVSADGIRNAAPFSFFQALSDTPPYVCLSISRHNPGGRRKDTLQNIVDTGDFVANIVSEDLAHAQDICAREVPPEIDEFALAGITPEDSVKVRAPRIRESPVNFECRLVQAMPLPNSFYTLVIGQVCLMHVRADVMGENGRINLQQLKPVGRMVGNAYCHTGDIFTLNHDTLARERANPREQAG